MIAKFKNLDKRSLFERPKNQPLTRKKAEQFLELIAQGNSVTKAAKAIGFTRRAMVEARAIFDDFNQLWNDADEEANDLQEDKLWGLTEKNWGPATLVWLKKGRPEIYATKLVNSSKTTTTAANQDLMATIAQMEKEEEDNVVPFKTEISRADDQT